MRKQTIEIHATKILFLIQRTFFLERNRKLKRKNWRKVNFFNILEAFWVSSAFDINKESFYQHWMMIRFCIGKILKLFCWTTSVLGSLTILHAHHWPILGGSPQSTVTGSKLTNPNIEISAQMLAKQNMPFLITFALGQFVGEIVPWCQIQQHFLSSFYPKSEKKTSQVKQLFALLGSACMKAVRKHIDEIHTSPPTRTRSSVAATSWGKPSERSCESVRHNFCLILKTRNPISLGKFC